jgi:integrase/recombinase XerD
MLPRVQRIRKDGAIRYRYHRVTGARLPDLPEDHPEFMAAWLAEEGRAAPPSAGAPKSGTVAHAIDAYLSSKDLDGASAGYAAAVRRHLLAVQARGREAVLAGLTEQHVRNDVARLDGHAARSRLKAWRRFLDWARRTGLITVDPSKGVDRPPVIRSDGHAPWTAEDVAAFRARWPIGTAARAIFEVLHWSGARVGDAAKLTRGMVRDGLLTYRQGKTRSEAHVPWEGPLPLFARRFASDRDLMHEALAALPTRGLLVLPKDESRGDGARSAAGMGNALAKAARAAGLVDRSAHGLRKTRLIACAEAEATTHQIAAWGGHTSLKEIEHYTEAADRRRALAPPAPVKPRRPRGKTAGK